MNSLVRSIPFVTPTIIVRKIAQIYVNKLSGFGLLLKNSKCVEIKQERIDPFGKGVYCCVKATMHPVKTFWECVDGCMQALMESQQAGLFSGETGVFTKSLAIDAIASIYPQNNNEVELEFILANREGELSLVLFGKLISLDKGISVGYDDFVDYLECDTQES